MLPSLALLLSPAIEAGAAIVYVMLATSVTIDALLKKSDVRGALGWIAAAWLSPLLGALLYYMFGINRVTRRALKFGRLDDAQAGPPAPAGPAHVPETIALLSQASMRITDAPLTAGNALTILEGGGQAYPAMLAAIGAARHCIAMTSYIFRNDAAGRDFADALIAARKRGVEVRVLLDGVGIGYFFPGIYLRLKAGGVATARFLHTLVPWRMPFLNMRNHRKLLVVDGSIGFMGGMNIGSENCAAPSAPRAVRDTHFRIDGPAVRLLMEAFARDWTFTTDENLEAACWWPELAAAGDVCARAIPSGPDADLYKIEMILGAALALARKRVRIVTPYFLPDARMQFAIAQACLRGVQVDIVLPHRSDQRVMDWAMRGHLRFFRHIPAALHASPAPFDHSKLLTMDDAWCLIGSSNWDARSFRLNFEFDLECYDPALTAALDRLIDARIARARPLSPQALADEPVLLRLRNAAARLLMPYL